MWLCIIDHAAAINLLKYLCVFSSVRKMLHKRPRGPSAKLRNRTPDRTRASSKSLPQYTLPKSPKSAHSSSDSEDERHDAAYESGTGSGSVSDVAHDEHHDADADADAPRVAQWVGIDSDAESQAGDETDEDEDDTNVVSSAQPLRDLVRSRVSPSLMQTY